MERPDAIKIVQQYLYAHPIYDVWKMGDAEISVSVKGSDMLAECFVDAALQTVQMPEAEIIVNWYVDTAEIKEKYLKARPALSRFISIDGERIREHYGRLNFIEGTEPKEGYVFSAEKVVSDEEAIASLELTRMAFNTHMVWEGKGNTDMEKARMRFAESYNFNSSCAFVLSIPYKLKSLGIISDRPVKMAEQAFEAVRDREQLGKLAMLEHRRWLIGMACDGYDVTHDYEQCVRRGTPRDRQNKLHPCIVRSSESTPLIDSEFACDKEMWDRENLLDYMLDELDMMSVSLHRAWKKEAMRLKENPNILGAPIAFLTDERNNYSYKTKRLLDRYLFCVKNIVDQSLPYADQFETYEKDLLACGEIKRNSQLQGYIKAIRERITPALESNMYKDFKAIDMNLIKKIPYILTWKAQPSVGMVLSTAGGQGADNQSAFNNVASPTALFAKAVYYVCLVDEKTDMSALKSRVAGIDNYYSYRGFKKDTYFRFYTLNGTPARIGEVSALVEELRKNGQVSDCEVRSFEDRNELSEDCVEWISANCDYFDGVNRLFDSALANGLLVVDITESGVPYFEFDYMNKRFANREGATELKYYSVDTFIQVEDMFALMNAKDAEYNYPDFADCYKAYWEVYSGEATGDHDFYRAISDWNIASSFLHSKGNALDIKDDNLRERIRKIAEACKAKGLVDYDSFMEDESKGRVWLEGAVITERHLRMLEKSGNVLESYVFFEACNQYWFDDVQSGYKFAWEKGGVINEMDCVLTKDYRSMLVECKSVKSPDEHYYMTLDSLAERFGIGHKKVIVMATRIDKPEKNKFLQRGQQMNIVTLHTYEQIKNIGKELRRIMEK